MRLLKSLAHAVGRAYCRRLCKSEYDSQDFRRLNTGCIEYHFLLQWLLQIAPTTVLDVGTGNSALPHLLRECGFVVTATDNIRDYWPHGMFNRHYHVLNDDIRRTTLVGPYDFITCTCVLEHIREHEAAISSMCGLLKPGGHLAMTFPYNEKQYVENAYDLPGATYGKDAPYVCQVYSRKEVDRWQANLPLEIVDQQYWQVFTGPLWALGERIRPYRPAASDTLHHLTCLLLRKQGGV